MATRHPHLAHSAPKFTSIRSSEEHFKYTQSPRLRTIKNTTKSCTQFTPKNYSKITNVSISTNYSTSRSLQKELNQGSRRYSILSNFHPSQVKISEEQPAEAHRQFQSRSNRTHTFVLAVTADQAMSKVKDIKTASEPNLTKKHQISETLLRLNSIQKNLRPETQPFKIKRLKSYTLLNSTNSTKAAMSFPVNQTSPLAKPKKQVKQRNPSITSVDSDERYALGTEVCLSSFYKESIKIQTYLRTQNKQHPVLERKLSEISKLISQEQVKLSKSYYAL